MDIQKAQELLDKHRAGTLTPAEKTLLDDWYLELEAQQAGPEPTADLIGKQKQVFARIDDSIRPRTVRLWPRWAAAAVVLISIGGSAYFLTHRPTGTPATKQQLAYHNDIPPGHQQATLTLANGQTIVLTKSLSGQIATQGQTKIQAGNGEIVYNASNQEASVSYNSVSTAKCEQSPFPLVLADGTKVWLNAESKLDFPTGFPGKERIVKLTGEAYFEVAHNAKQPFKVETNGQLTEDIGTSFNINSYSNENGQTTTLVEGAIKVNGTLLKPGQQSLLLHSDLKIRTANLKQVLSWKNGEFRFDGQQIDAIMRQLERWYNIEVVYEGDMPQEEFLGKISRYKNISQALYMLSYSKAVHFKVEGRRVTVIR